MQTSIAWGLAAVLAGALGQAGLARGTAQATGAGADQSQVKRGEYLVRVIGCEDCHTPKKMTPQGPVPDTARRLSGHPAAMKLPRPPAPKGPWKVAAAPTLTAWSGPWGISYSTNLTPDRETGIGSWDEATFLLAMRSGRHMGKGRPILPPMPWQNLAVMAEPDLKAIWAYLRTVPAVKNPVPEAVPAPTPPAAKK